LGQFFEELKRRNVFRVAIAYLAIAWLILQVGDIVLDSFGTPDWVMKTFLFALAAGFPLAVLFAWAYEVTPEGIKREKDVDRSQSITHGTGRKLNRMITVLLVAAVSFLLVDKFLLRGPEPGMQVGATEKSVAVLPFVAMSRGPDDEYFADGLTEEILNSLTRVPELLVTARTSAFFFKAQDIPVPEIAEKLGVAHVVEGSVRRDGERLRVTAQLIRAADGFHLWSENYDRSTDDTFGVQTDIAEKIASALDVFLDEETLARMKAAGFRNPEAYVAYQRGVELYNVAHDYWDIVPRLTEANRWFDRVIELEPAASRPHLLRADLYTHLLRDVYDTLSADEVADAEARLNADLDAAVRSATDSASQWSARYDQAFLSGNWAPLTSIIDEYAEAVTCPGSGWVNSAGISFGKADTVIALSRKMMECDPQNLFGWRDGVYAWLWAGDIETANDIGDEAVGLLDSDSLDMAVVYANVAAGRFDDAEQRIRRFTDEKFRTQLRLVLAAGRGDRQETGVAKDKLLEEQENRLDVQLIYLPLAGDREQANHVAAAIDAQPYGHITLLGVVMLCLCGAPWDIEVTPNFAEKLEEAGYAWPPVSPIDWPLKDW